MTEEEVASSTLESIEGAAGEGADLVGVRGDATPVEIVAAINRFVSKPPKRRSGRVDKLSFPRSALVIPENSLSWVVGIDHLLN